MYPIATPTIAPALPTLYSQSTKRGYGTVSRCPHDAGAPNEWPCFTR